MINALPGVFFSLKETTYPKLKISSLFIIHLPYRISTIYVLLHNQKPI